MEYTNPTTEQLIHYAVAHHEGILSQNGALCVETGARTGRSPKDRFIVQDDITMNTVDWGAVNQPISSAVFDALWKRVETYLENKKTFTSHLLLFKEPEIFSTSVFVPGKAGKSVKPKRFMANN